MDEPINFMAVGDTSPHLEPPEVQFEKVQATLDQADLTFAQVERTFSDKGAFRHDSMGDHSRKEPRFIAAYEEAGFDVAGLASNHSMDWGEPALVDTIARFEDVGIKTIGVGADIDEAREPAIVERNGTRFAFLGYCSVLLPQYWATEDRAGCAPLRAKTYYEPYEYQPGTPARIESQAMEKDLEALRRDVERATEDADIVIVSNHWGIHHSPGTVADYQRDIAHVAVEAGCDLIIGHHQHLMNGIEFFDDVPCAYSLGNFAMTFDPNKPPSHAAPSGEYPFSDIYSAEYGPDTSYTYNEHYPKSGILEVQFYDDHQEVAFIPAYVATRPEGPPESEPVVLEPADPEFDEVVDFLRWSCERLGTDVELEGNRLVVQ